MLIDLPEQLLKDVVAFRNTLRKMDEQSDKEPLTAEDCYIHHGEGLYSVHMLVLDLRIMDSDFKVDEVPTKVPKKETAP